MSFSEKRTARQGKEQKSFVRQSDTPANSTPHSPEGIETQNKTNDIQIVPRNGLYKCMAPELEIRSSQTSGRGLWATRSISPGRSLIAVKPHVSVLSNHNLELYCSSCFTPAPQSGLKRCTGCKVVCYCDAKCQKRDWAFHKNECLAIQKWAESAPSPDLAIPNDAVRGLGRIMHKRKKEGPESVWTREIDAMQSHRSSLPPSASELHTHLAHSLVRYLNLSSPTELADFGFASAADLVDIISRFITNTFTATTSSLSPIGISISPPAALINHSCDPNTAIVFPRISIAPALQEPVMHAVTLRPIEPGEEILTSYIDTTTTHAIRQKTLQETYNFTCHCTLCTHPPDVDPREAMWCPKRCGGVCPVPTEENSFTRCIKCKAVVSSTDAVLDALRVGQEGLDKATALQFKDPTKSLQLTTNLLPILTSTGLTPPSHPLLALTRLHQSLLIASLPQPPHLTQETLDEVIRVATKSVEGLKQVLRPSHPVRGIALAELGKLLVVDEPAPTHLVAASSLSSPSSPSASTSTALPPPQKTSPPTYPPSGPRRLELASDILLEAMGELAAGFGFGLRTSGGEIGAGGEVGKEVRQCMIKVNTELGYWKKGVRELYDDTYRSRKR